VEYVNTIYPTQAGEKNEEIIGGKTSYDGMPQNLFVNNDGSFVMVYEEIKNVSWRGGHVLTNLY
jgi:hypothetical protein